MALGSPRSLTDRQAAVMERIDRRVPIKVIAMDLGVSETRINQHIRALKDHYEAGSLGELVEKHRQYKRENAASQTPPARLQSNTEGSKSAKNRQENQKEGDAARSVEEEAKDPFSEAACNIPQVPATVFGFDMGNRDKAATIELSDVMPLIERTPWLKPGEPKVVPGMLDGEHAVLFRLVAIVGIAFGLLAAIILTLTAAVTISEALDGHAAVPVDEAGFT